MKSLHAWLTPVLLAAFPIPGNIVRGAVVADLTKSKAAVPKVTGTCPESECAFTYDAKNRVIGGGGMGNRFYVFNPAQLAWSSEEIQGAKPGIKGDKVGKFVYEGDRPSRWAKENNVWLQGYWFWDWADQYQQVASINTTAHTIALKPPCHHYGYRKGMRFYAVNVLAELDAPGEWYLDRTAGMLYLWAAGATTWSRTT